MVVCCVCEFVRWVSFGSCCVRLVLEILERLTGKTPDWDGYAVWDYVPLNNGVSTCAV
jgi:hypothetical protein